MTASRITRPAATDSTAAKARPSRPSRRLSPADRWYTHVTLTIVCLVLAAPVLYAALISTQDNTDFFAYRLLPGESFLANFRLVWVQRHLGTYLWNSTLQALVITTGKAITSLLAGLAFVHFRFKGKWMIFGLVLITLMMPTEISIIALFRIVSGLGWDNSLTGITVPFLASATGAFVFRQHFANLPADLSEAAQLDGAGPLTFLWKVLVPMSWNVVAALAVIQFLYSWNMYLWPSLIIQSEAHQVVQVGLASLRNTGGGQSYGPMMLGAFLASIPPVIVFLVFQKRVLTGFAITRDK